MLNVFITGTDVNVGKTFITAGLAATMQSLGYQTCVYKPVDTDAIQKNGFAQSPDLVFVKNVDPYIKIASSYLLKHSASPSIAAEMEGKIIDKNVIKKDYYTIGKDIDCIITECTGGIMTPLAPNFFVSDMVKELNLPVVIIVKPSLGVINQTLLTINHLQEKRIKVRGVIINNYPEKTDDIDLKNLPRLIEEYSDVKILGIIKNIQENQKIEKGQKIDPSNLITEILNGIDVESVFDIKIAKLDV